MNLIFFSHLLHIIARACRAQHPSVRGLLAAASLRQVLFCVGNALLPAVGPLFSSWCFGSFPCLFLTSSFTTHHVVLNLHVDHPSRCYESELFTLFWI